MFVLVVMSLGRPGDVILDCDNQPIPLINIIDLLSPRNFPAMKGKPKMMIIQACSGGKLKLHAYSSVYIVSIQCN